MPATSWGYRVAIRLGTALAPALGAFNPKIRAGDAGRRGAGDRLLEWARWNRQTGRPLVWFHAASVGEGLQAVSVIRALQRLRPDCQLVYTHFSPSAEEFARRLPVDVADYLPYDLAPAITRLLAALEPDILVFAKLDLWPELATRAATTGCQVAIVAATVSAGSARLRWPARAMLEPGYQVVAAAGAISPDDARRLSRLGVPGERIQVSGDPRFDSVAERVSTVDPAEPLLRFGSSASTLVAGSSWPADDAVLLPAFSRVRRTHPEARLILVPHEPTEAHLSAVETKARGLGLPHPVRLSAAEGPVPLLLVDRVGVLAALYGCGTMSYVGGGFGHAGLHSVLEPAAWGIPVTFGPHWHNSRDARLLLEAGAANALPGAYWGRAVATLERHWNSWIESDAERISQGQKARGVVERGRGASERSAEMLASLIVARRLRTSPIAAPGGPQSER
jgi:3-deoxy-D-manno-octulosonic-acid transferase